MVDVLAWWMVAGRVEDVKPKRRVFESSNSNGGILLLVGSLQRRGFLAVFLGVCGRDGRDEVVSYLVGEVGLESVG